MLLILYELAAPLPDAEPGGLPLLEHLSIEAGGTSTPLPPSWAAPGALPSLRSLQLAVRFTGGLPDEWARGFRHLFLLSLSGDAPVANGMLEGRARPAPQPLGTLPASWASGFPSLQHLRMEALALSGPLPQAWVQGGFPQLEDM